MSSNNINNTPDSLTLAKGRRKRKSSNHGETFRSPSKIRNYNEDQDPESDTNKKRINNNVVTNNNNNTTIDNNKSMSYDEDDDDNDEESVVQQSYEFDYFGNDDDDDDDGANNDDNSEKDDDSEISVDVDMKPQSLVQTKILNLEILCHQAVYSHKKDAHYYFDELETQTDFIRNISKTSTNFQKILRIVTLIQIYCYAPIHNSQQPKTTSSKKKDRRPPSEDPPLETLEEHDWIEAINLLKELRDSISGFVVDLTDELVGVQYHEILQKLNVQRALSILREAVAMKRGQGGQSKYLDSNVLQKYNTCIFGNIKNKELIEHSLNIGLYIKSKRSLSSPKSPANATTPTKKTAPIRIAITEVTSFLRNLVKNDDYISLKQFQESFYEYLRDCYDVIPKSKLDEILLGGNMKNDCPFITTITPEMINSDTRDDDYHEQHTQEEDIQEEQEQIQFNDDNHEDEENQSDSDSNYNNGSEEEDDENDHNNDNNTMISTMNKKRKRRQKTKASTTKVSAKAKSSKSVSSRHKHKHNNKTNNDDDDNESKTSSVSEDQDLLSNHVSSDDDDEEEEGNTQDQPSSQVTATPPPNKKIRGKTNNNNRESLTSNSSGKKSISNSTNSSSKKKKKETISTRHRPDNEDRPRTRMATKKNKNSGKPIGGQQLHFEDSDEEEQQQDDDDDDNDSEVTDPSPTKHPSSLPKREKFIRERQRLKNKNKTTSSSSSPQGSIISTLSTKRKRRFWTQEEKQAVLDGVKNWGVGNWAAIKVEFNDVLASRTAVQIKDCYRTLRKQAEKEAMDNDQYIE